MNDQNVMTIQSYEELLLFLYVHIATADFTVQSSEVEVILRKMKRLFPTKPDLHGMFIEMRDYYDSLSDREIEKLMVENTKRYVTDKQKADKIFTDLYALIVADGLILESETQAMYRIRVLVKGVLEKQL